MLFTKQCLALKKPEQFSIDWFVNRMIESSSSERFDLNDFRFLIEPMAALSFFGIQRESATRRFASSSEFFRIINFWRLKE